MKIQYTKRFSKRYRALRKNEQTRVESVLLLFAKDPYHKSLSNHLLKGRLQGKRAISVGGDLRIVFKEKDGYAVVLFLDIGSHNQVY